jgi:GT2 family glycosyltransferase
MLTEFKLAPGETELPASVAEPALSVLMAVRNGADYLDESLASLAAQTFEDFEIVLVDNGSIDRTPAIVRDWARREPRLRAFRLEGRGVSASRNLAAARARAPLLAALDADDLALPHRLAVQVAAMNARPRLALLGSAVELIDRRGRRIGSLHYPPGDAELRTFLREGKVFTHSTVVMRRDVFLAAGGYRAGLGLAEDYDLWLRLADHGELANLAEPLVRYRMHDGNTTARGWVRQAIAIGCVGAASEARRLGRPEPFRRGVPVLRDALPLLGVTRAAFRSHVRLTALRLAVSRFFLRLPVPPAIKGAIRASAVRLGFRRMYVLALQQWLAFSRLRTER